MIVRQYLCKLPIDPSIGKCNFFTKLETSYFILRPFRGWVLIAWLLAFGGLTASGQSTPVQPSKGGVPDPAQPTQRAPDAPVGTNPNAARTAPASTTNPAGDSRAESDLERELNQKQSRPGRLGPPRSAAKPNAVRPNGPDTTLIRRAARATTVQDSVRVAPAPAVPKARPTAAPATATSPRPAAPVTLPRSVTATAATPRSTSATAAKPRPTTPGAARSASATSTGPRSQTATAANGARTRPDTLKPVRVTPGLVSPNVVRPESRTRPNVALPGSATAVTDSTTRVAARDSSQTKDSFETTVKYQAKDSTIYAADGQTVELYGDASVTYGKISLKADYIRLNYLTNEVYAKGRYDSTAKKLIGRPVFQDGEGKYDSKEIRYNFKTKKGKIQGVITQQGEGNIRGQNVKKDAEDNLYIGKAIYTTCNLATPHFHINASKLKVVHNKQVVAGPFNLVINQVPLPIGLPFGFFPFPKKKDIGVSGILVPTYGEEPNGRGFYLRDGGYYWAVNENLGMQFRGQIYSRGSWGLGVSSAYNKRYRYSGLVDLRFNRNRSGDRVDITQVPRNDFAITWSHAPVPRGRQSFSANVNVTSNSFNQFNSSTGTNAYISNVAGSSVQYSRQFGQYVRAGANVRVNQQFGQVNPLTGVRQNGKTDVSSDFNLGVNQIAPFALRGGSGRWYESFRVGLDVSGSIAVSNTILTRIDTSGLGFPIVVPAGRRVVSSVQNARDSLARADSIRRGLLTSSGTLPNTPNLVAFSVANLPLIWQNRVIQARYSIPVSLPNFKILRYINLTPGFSIQGNIYTKKLNYIPEGNAVRIDTARGVFASYNFSVNASFNTRLYGTYFIRSKRIQAFRHTLAPSISFSYVPDFTNPVFGQFVKLPAVGSLAYLPEYRRTLSVFRGLGGTGGSASSTQSAFLSFGIVNQLEMKVRTRSDSAGQEFKKIPIFDNLSITGSYNLLAPDYKLSPIAMAANTQIFKNISFNMSATFDPYAYRPYGGTPVYPLTTYAPGTTPLTPLSYSPLLLTPVSYINQDYPRVPNLYALQAGQGLMRLTNFQAYLSARFAPKQANKPKTSPNATDATLKSINLNPDLYVDFNIPWSVNASYTFGLTYLTPKLPQVIQALTLTGDLSLTPKWKITVQTGYDFKYNSPTLTTIGINRDLHCWEMAFNWTPYSGNNFRSGNYSFDLRARSSILQELKLSRRRSFYDNGGFYGR